MDVSSMLSNGGAQAADGAYDSQQNFTIRNNTFTQNQASAVKTESPAPQRPLRSNNMPPPAGTGYSRASPAKKGQKHVVFQLVDGTDPRLQARLPMRVMISQNDNTESIITSVKNFYGLYECGVSFETEDQVGMIPAYDNFHHDMNVIVRTVAQHSPVKSESGVDSASPSKRSLGAAFEPTARSYLQPSAHSPSKSGARSVGVRSLSPTSDIGKRSASSAPGGPQRPKRTKSKDSSMMGAADGYSSGDDGEGSVASRRSKAEQVKAEISVENIVEGGRRKRAFESSQLPLFVPPQVPATNSLPSISPQRKVGGPTAASPYGYPSNQQTFSYQQPLQSPQGYAGAFPHPGNGYQNGYGATYQQQPPRQLRGYSGTSYPRGSNGGVMPTPDPTIGSVKSDEDAARSLLRLSDPFLAFSHGRTSTSTVDDAFSGKADAASSDEEDYDEEEEEEQSRLPAVPPFYHNEPGPQRKKQRLMNDLPSDPTSGEEYEDRRDGTFDSQAGSKASKSKGGKFRASMPSTYNTDKGSKPRANSLIKPKSKSTSQFAVPMSPSSLPAGSRKGSIASTNFQNQLGEDEEDLSSKPRCNRCRKSKKGCDRQRPCGRCKDAGIGLEGCISEDDQGQRKGRFGRHMGIPVKKGEEGYIGGEEEMASPQMSVPANGYFIAPALPKDKGGEKKRKR
ncbi:uncharacterized protein LTR77_007192 [Saxophila tyrrhenica]|uniref:Zn(2)-C6 fungal-type domain-containing protein n=1 Tax=Saxophila tyrrhenica TaxID=1690608 RepID=A0AAV9P4S3_9PEZI|nr:hypothetical protein LTR77_007192 [Saxophila tyrrhenica]